MDLVRGSPWRKFQPKFYGKDYPVEYDPGRTLVSAKRLDGDTVELTSKRNGEVVAVKRMSVMPDRKSIHVVFEAKEGTTIMAFDVRTEPQYRLPRWQGH